MDYVRTKVITFYMRNTPPLPWISQSISRCDFNSICNKRKKNRYLGLHEKFRNLGNNDTINKVKIKLTEWKKIFARGIHIPTKVLLSIINEELYYNKNYILPENVQKSK